MIGPIARLALTGLAAFLALGAVVASPLVAPAAHGCSVRAAGANHVAVLVQHGNGAVVSSCVSFDTGQIRAEDAMNASGFRYGTVQYGGLGKAVCQVDGEPATYPPSCFTANSPYWSMFVSKAGGPWVAARLGVSAQQLADGDALGWRYIPPGGGMTPASPAGVCSPQPAAAVPSATTAPPAPPVAVTTPEKTPEVPSPSPTPELSPVPGPSAAQFDTTSPPSVSVASTELGRPAGPQLAWLVLAAAAGGLIGLLAVRLLAERLRQ